MSNLPTEPGVYEATVTEKVEIIKCTSYNENAPCCFHSNSKNCKGLMLIGVAILDCCLIDCEDFTFKKV